MTPALTRRAQKSMKAGAPEDHAAGCTFGPERLSPTTWSGRTVHILLSNRTAAALVLLAAVIHLPAAWLLAEPLHQCPFYVLTQLPCPGCGLSRAGRFLLTGRLQAMWQQHPFAPYFALWGILLAGAALLPPPWRDRWIFGWTAFEERFRIHAVMLSGFLFFGVARLLWQIVRLA